MVDKVATLEPPAPLPNELSEGVLRAARGEQDSEATGVKVVREYMEVVRYDLQVAEAVKRTLEDEQQQLEGATFTEIQELLDTTADRIEKIIIETEEKLETLREIRRVFEQTDPHFHSELAKLVNEHVELLVNVAEVARQLDTEAVGQGAQRLIDAGEPPPSQQQTAFFPHVDRMISRLARSAREETELMADFLRRSERRLADIERRQADVDALFNRALADD